MFKLSRRTLLGSAVAMGATTLTACGGSQLVSPIPPMRTPTQPVSNPFTRTTSGNNVLRIIASSGFAEDPNRGQLGISRLISAGFTVTNEQTIYRRHQRFAGSDAERVADMQDIATGRVATPKVIMGMRGGYGAHRLLPHIDFASLGARMREKNTMFFGFSDVCALQLALLAKGNMLSFAGPMVYSEFGKPQPSTYTMQSFIDGSTNRQHTLFINTFQRQHVNIEGVFWGGNLSVLAALVGTPYLPDINGGILFLEDVSEQPYRIERMLQTLLLAGVLQKQQAIVFGDFRMGSIRDVYDASYDFNSVITTMSRLARVPVLTDFPFGHIANKSTFPLGAIAKIQSNVNGYSVQFRAYPTLDANSLTLNTLLPPPPTLDIPAEFISETSSTDTVIE